MTTNNICNGIKKVSVFCGANYGVNSIYAELAQQLGDALLNADLELVYGGGNNGLMGVIANHVMTKGGKVTGVMPKVLIEKEHLNMNLTALHIVENLHVRKAMLTDLADAFIIMPGGAGTLDEFFDVFTHVKLGYHDKPFGILNVNNYYDDLIKFLNHATNEGFISASYINNIAVSASPGELINLLLRSNFSNTTTYEERISY